jgi:hypothetical protein
VVLVRPADADPITAAEGFSVVLVDAPANAPGRSAEGPRADGTSAEFALAQRTYTARAYHDDPDWTNDAIHAARLGLASEVSARLAAALGKYQIYPSGLAALDANMAQEPYLEQAGVLTTAITEAIAQDYDGTLRIAPAWPTSWGLTGTVFLRGRSKVHVRFQSGAVAFAVLEAGTTGSIQIKNAWGAQPTTQATVLDDMGLEAVAPTTSAVLAVNATQGGAYLIKRSSDPIPALVQVSGTAATKVKTLSTRIIGIP